eukprot:gnl/Dysnectes_brevis/743_a816_3546.p1 GENE.gnl/Dysnectes_brevis/743_a816_3546~~gnl/Dysnectes_brevis/743_a816_3546.p1  ORF type:complete len:1201 (+),score=519.96 gnl/Dysnectes_brevis/743_a816_3546:1410-5012(+)
MFFSPIISVTMTLHCADGNFAASLGSYKLIESTFIYPITPASPMADYIDGWATKNKKNVFGTTVACIQSQAEGGAAAAMHGSLVGGNLCATYTSSQGLLLMIPNIYHLVGECLPGVLHVANRSVGTHTAALQPDHSDIYACRQTNAPMLASSCAQEAHDMAIVAHLAAIKCQTTFIHFFEGFRVSHQLESFYEVPDEDVAKMVDYQALTRWRRDDSLNPENPFGRNPGVPSDLFWQITEAQTPIFDAVPNNVQGILDQFKELTGREYKLFEYCGHPEAERLIVMMGCGSQTAEMTIKKMVEAGEKVALLRVRLWRPFSFEHFIGAIPASVKRIAVLDRSREHGAGGDPLYQDCLCALHRTGRLRDMESVVNGRYGVVGKPFAPRHVFAVFEALKAENPKANFVVGITDDLCNMSIPVPTATDLPFCPLPETYRECMLWGLGSDGTISAGRSAINIINSHTDNHCQANIIMDGKKSGGLTISELRFGPEICHPQYGIENADYVACHHPSYVSKYHVMLKSARKGATLVLNMPTGTDLNVTLPGDMRREIAEKEIKLYVVDAFEMAKRVGLGNRINTIMITAFFKFGVPGLIDFETACAELKTNARKAYAKAKQEVVEANMAAVDIASSELDGCKIDYDRDLWLGGSGFPTQIIPGAPDVVNEIIQPVKHLVGADIPTSKCVQFVRGYYPPAMSKYDRPSTAVSVPRWIPDKCIQCNLCAAVCPHTCIRPFVVTKSDTTPEGFETKPYRGRVPSGLTEEHGADLSVRIQLSPTDCRGCGTCVNICPKGALEMVPLAETASTEQPLWDYAHRELTGNCDSAVVPETCNLKDLQLRQPYMEFNGACGGCPQPAIYKMVTQLFGDSMIAAVAVGCCLVFSQYGFMRPYTTDAKGRGPAVATSLFEDNAEFGWGIAVASDINRSNLLQFVKDKLPETEMAPELKELCGEWIEAFNDRHRSRMLADRIQALLTPSFGATDPLSLTRRLWDFKSLLPKRSKWIFGGAGWAYDIGFGGLDHVLASGLDITIMVLDTEVYSNTGGQRSKATPLGAVARFAAAGKRTEKKDLAMIAMSYPNVFVGSIALNANPRQAIRVLTDAVEYKGPSIVQCFTPCIEHGWSLSHSALAQKLAVDTSYWLLFSRHPEHGFKLDSRPAKKPLNEYLDKQLRFRVLVKERPEEAAALQKQLADQLTARYERYAKIEPKVSK